MRLPGYFHNAFVATHALGHMMYGYIYILVCMYMCVYVFAIVDTDSFTYL